MKRDMELVRKILIAIEDHPEATKWVSLKFNNYSDQDISYHVELLFEHGLIEATDCSSMDNFCWQAKRLTWDGNDFIQAIRDDTRWNKVKKWITDAGKIVTMETLKGAVKHLFL